MKENVWSLPRNEEHRGTLLEDQGAKCWGLARKGRILRLTLHLSRFLL